MEVGVTFSKILEHAGIFKRDEKGRKAFLAFIDQITKHPIVRST